MGADRSAGAPPPVIILVEPQLGGNIGAAARAMLNCGLTSLRLVRPREAWPNKMAVKLASGADVVLDSARLFDSLAEAVADLHRVYAVTARGRDMNMAILSPPETAAEIRGHGAGGFACGLMFGREADGLSNEEVAYANKVVTVPLNPDFSSLNLGQAVLLLAYEWRRAGNEASHVTENGGGRPREALATKGELINFFNHLEGELDDCGFLRPPEKRPAMIRNIRAMFQRAQLSGREVKTLHGIVSGLRRPPAGK